jgi:hypothetical protein
MSTDLAVTVEDQPGVLAGMGEALGKAGINIIGVSGVAATGPSVVHLLVDDAAATRNALADAGFTAVEEREVAVVDVEDRPGALGETARKLADAGINIELVYLATGTRLVIGAADLAAVRAAL